MVGKRKVYDIQFTRNAAESHDETGNRKKNRHYDEDELAEEQEERRNRARLDEEFRRFADKVQATVNPSFFRLP